MDHRRRPENQIAVCVERTEKACLVKPEMRLNSLESTDRDKEGIFDRGVISPKTDCLPGLVIASAVIRKLQGHRYLSLGGIRREATDAGHERGKNRDAAHYAQCITIV